MGNWSKVAELRPRIEKVVTYWGFPFIYLAQIQWDQGQDPLPFVAKALNDSNYSPYEYNYAFVVLDIQRVRGEIALAQGDLITAEDAWLLAFQAAEREGVPLGPYLADLARLRVRQGNADLARELLAQALDLQGPVDLAAAEVFLALGDIDSAHKHVLPAYRRAWADGPPYVFYFELKRARKVLTALNMPEPQLPPFDPSQIEPLPYEAEIRAFLAEQEDKDRSVNLIDSTMTQDVLTQVAQPEEEQNQSTARHWWQFWRRD